MKKKGSIWVSILLICIMDAISVSAQAQEIDEKTMYIYVEEDVIDVQKWDSMKAEKAAKFDKEKKIKIKSLNNEIELLSQLILIGARKEKIEDEQLYIQAAKVFRDYQVIAPELRSIYISKKAGYEKEKVQAVGQIQDEDKIINMFNKKKKVSNLFIPYLSSLKHERENELSIVNSSKPDLSTIPIPHKKVKKRTFNPNNRAYCYRNSRNSGLDYLDMEMQMKGWKWVDTEISKEVYTMAPFSMTYEKYDSHPQYRVLDDKVFDNDGNLVCLLYLLRTNEDVIKLLREALLNEIYISDFKANKYDILKTPTKTQEFVKNLLGMPNKFVDAKTAKKNQKILNDYFRTQAKEVMVAAGSWQQRAEAKREADEAEGRLGAMLFRGLIDENYNPDIKTARTFIQKIEEDHKNVLDNIWRISRVSPTSFKVAFMKGYVLTYTGLVTINQTKPYSWQFSFKLVPNDEIIDEKSPIWDM